jgi:hypothetical protein
MGALLSGDENRVRGCLEQGADINSVQSPTSTKDRQIEAICESPLEIAATKGWYRVVSLLLRSGADPSQYSSALKAAAQHESLPPKRSNLANSRRKSGNYRAICDLIRLWDFSYRRNGASYSGLRALLDSSQAGALPDAVTCQWEVPEVIKTSQAKSEGVYDPEILGRIVVLTGLDGEYEATTCEEYLKREWGDIGIEVLDWVIFGLELAMGINRESSEHQAKQPCLYPRYSLRE